MTITASTTIGDIVAAHPSSVRVFQRYGVDFCCGGKRTLETVCREKGLSLTEVAGAIEASSGDAPPDARDWRREPLGALVDHIVVTFHEPLREELPRLEAMAAKVARVHGDRAPALTRVQQIVTELAEDLHSHMQKEERVLFPAIAAAERGAAYPELPLSAPIAVMEHEHDHAGHLLAELREATSGYVVPGWGCATFRALYHGLEELESTMHRHVHLENHVLFPRALDPALRGAGA